jgi:hypothetical protein
MVLYTGLDGQGAFGRCEDLAAAAAEVERLRNEQDIEDARIFRLEEIKFEIKPYFRVALPELTEAPPVPTPIAPATTSESTSWAPTAVAASDVPAMVVPPPPPPPAPVAPVAPMAYDSGIATDDEAIVGSRRGLFGR